MLHIPDIRETRVYREAVEEGEKKGEKKGIKKGIKKGQKLGLEQGVAIARLAAEKKSVDEIAAILKLDVRLIRRALGMIDERVELFEALAELARRYPQWRVGQLVENVAGWAGVEAWDAEDEQFLSAAQAHLAAKFGLMGGEPLTNQAMKQTGA